MLRGNNWRAVDVKVKCIDDGGWGVLKNGEEYEVLREYTRFGFTYYEIKGKFGGWLAERFEEVKVKCKEMKCIEPDPGLLTKGKYYQCIENGAFVKTIDDKGGVSYFFAWRFQDLDANETEISDVTSAAAHAIKSVMAGHDGVGKHGCGVWRGESQKSHIGKGLQHAQRPLMGCFEEDVTDADPHYHLKRAICRLSMALALAMEAAGEKPQPE